METDTSGRSFFPLTHSARARPWLFVPLRPSSPFLRQEAHLRHRASAAQHRAAGQLLRHDVLPISEYP